MNDYSVYNQHTIGEKLRVSKWVNDTVLYDKKNIHIIYDKYNIGSVLFSLKVKNLIDKLFYDKEYVSVSMVDISHFNNKLKPDNTNFINLSFIKINIPDIVVLDFDYSVARVINMWNMFDIIRCWEDDILQPALMNLDVPEQFHQKMYGYYNLNTMLTDLIRIWFNHKEVGFVNYKFKQLFYDLEIDKFISENRIFISITQAHSIIQETLLHTENNIETNEARIINDTIKENISNSKLQVWRINTLSTSFWYKEDIELVETISEYKYKLGKMVVSDDYNNKNHILVFDFLYQNRTEISMKHRMVSKFIRSISNQSYILIRYRNMFDKYNRDKFIYKFVEIKPEDALPAIIDTTLNKIFDGKTSDV